MNSKTMPSHASTFFKTTRPPFLILTPACLFLGYAIVLMKGNSIDTLDFFLVFVGALSAHISVNTFNEYSDFKSGLDAITSRTPFSGGSGGLIENPDASQGVLTGAVLSLLCTACIGLYFVFKFGLGLLPIGVIGVLCIVLYTNQINRSPLICLISPGLCFGPLMIGGTYFALTGELSADSFYVSLVPFFLINNLLLLNQFPDIEADQTVGRRHFPIAYGNKKSVFCYGFFVIATVASLSVTIASNIIPQLGYISLLSILPAGLVFTRLLQNPSNQEKLPELMGLNVGVAITTPVLLAIAILIG